jgi:prepilin signal peptidase PulO-like enzyme (type II secretory pathway)
MNIKNFSKRAKTILLEKEWLTGILLPLVLGTIVYFSILILNGKLQNSLFWGIFSAYMLFGGFFSISQSPGTKFEKTNMLIGTVAFFAGILGLIFWPEIELLGWPTLIAGLLLTIVSGSGKLSKKIEINSDRLKRKYNFN